jgi:hypothetical protein
MTTRPRRRSREADTADYEQNAIALLADILHEVRKIRRLLEVAARAATGGDEASMIEAWDRIAARRARREDQH